MKEGGARVRVRRPALWMKTVHLPAIFQCEFLDSSVRCFARSSFLLSTLSLLCMRNLCLDSILAVQSSFGWRDCKRSWSITMYDSNGLPNSRSPPYNAVL